MSGYVMAMDLGTTSVRCILFDRAANICAVEQQEFNQIFPHPGWVEHDPEEIWEKQLMVSRLALSRAGISAEEISAIGITNQRETTVVWDKKTGRPVYNAIVWQCRRTSDYTDSLVRKGLSETVREKTGLIIDPYFSGTKIRWILNNVPGVRERAENGELLFGTIETWIIWKLTKGRVHATDYSNASRTMLFNIRELKWDEELLKELDIPASMLPEAMPSSGIFGETDAEFFGTPVPITGAAGDQQCALFGQTCFSPGEVKNTYGTGCFMLMNTGEKPVRSSHGLVTTIAWGVDNKVEYALEGSVFCAGSAIQWLRDELGLLKNAAESEKLALKVNDTGGVYMVPAFTGLGAPYWDPYARGTIVGLTRGSNRYHIIRAVLESLAFQTADVLEAMKEDSEIDIQTLMVDGGASMNNFLMQKQANLLNATVLRPSCIETTARGAAFLAGLCTGFWSSKAELRELNKREREFIPNMNETERAVEISVWRRAVNRSMKWVSEQEMV